MSLMDDFNAGHKAYYEKVPRYKNPYEDSPHFDDSNYVAWDEGWLSAESEHRLFTENQELKEKISSQEQEESLLQNKLDSIVDILGDMDLELDKRVFSFSREKMKIHVQNIRQKLGSPE
jgi:hypothetical protein